MSDNKITVPNDLRDFFSANIDAGTEDGGGLGKQPILKVVGALTEAPLEDGTEATRGKLYHTVLQQEFDEVEANILYVKKCRLPGLENKEEMKLNYIVGGFLRKQKVPFIAYVHGLGLQPFWEYQKEVSTLISVYKIPMFAQVVKIGTTSREGSGSGKKKVYKVFSFTMAKENGSQAFETNLDILKTFKEGIEKMKKTINTLISLSSGSEENDEYVEQANRTTVSPQKQLPTPDLPGDVPQDAKIEDADISDDIPF